MGRADSHEEDFVVDIESGCRVWREDDGSVNEQDRVTYCGSLCVSSDADSVENAVVINIKLEGTDSAEKKVVKEKHKKTRGKKAPKPPRPPRGPSLDPADQKLIREFTELAMLKRIKTERFKALKKMKATKSPSSSSNSVFAMLFTIIFCLVILLQGITTKTSSHASLDVSPVSSTTKSLILVQYPRQASTDVSNTSASESPSLLEQVSGQDPYTIAKQTIG